MHHHSVRALAVVAVAAVAPVTQAGPFDFLRVFYDVHSTKFAPAQEDYNNNGVEDFLSFNIDTYGLEIIDGLDGAVLKSITGFPSNGALFCSLPDSDGDGKRDYVVTLETSVWAIKSSGPSGSIGSVPLLFSFQNAPWAMYPAMVGDWLMLASGDTNKVMLVNPASGAVKARLVNSTASGSGLLGQSAVNLGDVNDDGVDDFASSGGNVVHPGPWGSVFVFSGTVTTAGSSFVQINTLSSTERLAELTGIELIGGGDAGRIRTTSVNLGDPYPDNGVKESLIISSAPLGYNGRGGLAAHLLTAVGDGTVTASLLMTHVNNDFRAQWSLANVGDVSCDGHHDVAIWSTLDNGRIYIVSGAGIMSGYDAGDVIQTIAALPGDELELDDIYSMDDFDGDGRKELALQSFYLAANHNGNNRDVIEVYSGLCSADFDCTGFVDFEDFTTFVLAFEAGGANADFDGSGFVDFEDYDAFVLAFEAGC